MSIKMTFEPISLNTEKYQNNNLLKAGMESLVDGILNELK